MDHKELDNGVPEQFRDAFDKTTAGQHEPSNLAGSENGNSEANKKENQGEITMENTPDLKEQVRAEVESIFKAKDAEAQVTAKISGLETEKADLAKKVEELTTANAELTKTLSEKDTAIAEAQSKVDSAEAEKNSAIAKADEAKSELDSIKKEQTIAKRKEELATAGLLIADEAIQAKQIVKISAMDDAQFGEYVEESKALASITGGSVQEIPAKKEDGGNGESQEKATASSKTVVSAPVVDESIGKTLAKTMAFAQGEASVDPNNVSRYAKM